MEAALATPPLPAHWLPGARRPPVLGDWPGGLQQRDVRGELLAGAGGSRCTVKLGAGSFSGR